MSQSEIFIHAAPAAVFRAFTNIGGWATWYPGVVGARWAEGEPWREGSRFAIETRNVLGITTSAVGTVRLRSLDQVIVWESVGSGLTVVATARFEDEVGGCRLTLSKNFHGPLSLLMPLLVARQRGQVTTGLNTLKAQIERQPRR